MTVGIERVRSGWGCVDSDPVVLNHVNKKAGVIVA